ncbi:DUF3367 domain-containing protein [Calidifontibacter sp. DB0510]|uniref:DUF3367 domain-containing protein n=1 Tax=Metallococcus carri TaxID=1656884 RepID=A0A967E9K3_9MICO|nr:alpha-(1->3)-arabinofuranosyltransferase family protein [Metallococcus carri]NHN54949.1 DUF3367 domain-containing protein [Metallococcus carri]NOP37295.1 DUF3367 domain-containing protein [Calidifontibacter sp. DB2511S]
MTRRSPVLWLSAIVVALVPWLIQPGRTEPDTKVDLVISPWRYLGRALRAWNAHSGLGELQNQAYGYLFPMGPFFGAGSSVGLPAWVIQRAWWTLLVLVAFTGTVTLVRRLGLGGPRAAVLAGAAYAFGPRVLTLLAANSVEAWPYAVAPWAVVAAHRLLDPALRGRRLAGALAVCGLLATATGGVNATASAVIQLLPFGLLLLDPVGRRRLIPWGAAVLAGAVWWLAPLLVLGGFAYPFLDYIETSSITTAVTSVPNTLRGANDWVAYILDSQGHPVWQGGWVAAQSLTSILATCALAAVGVLGVCRLPARVRTWALVCVVAGTLAMVLGHPGFAGSPVAGPVRALLDGPLAALRNVHKFDPLIRLPLCLGLAVMAHRLARAPRPRVRWSAGLVALLVLAAATPLWQGRVGDAGAYPRLPAEISRTAARMDALAAADGGSTLLLPTSRTATYTWGRTTDEPLSAAATSPVVVRASAPLGPPAATRLLDAADELAATGQPQPALASGLARMGIRRVVVRHDLAASAGAGAWQAVERTLASSPGWRRVGADGALTLWQVTVPAPPTRSDRFTVVDGGPEAIFAALATGVMSAGTPTALLGDVRTAANVVTDSLRWRAYNNGVPTVDAYSPTLLATDSSPTKAGARDLLPAMPAGQRPHRVLQHLQAVSVSSDGADPFARAYAGPLASAWSAIDGDPSTAWLTGGHESTARLRLTLTAARDVGALRIVPAPRLPVGTSVVVTTDRERFTVPADRATTVRTTQPTRSVTVTLSAPAGATDPVLGLAEVSSSAVRWGSVIAIPRRVNPDRTLLLQRDMRTTAGRPTGEDGTVIKRQVTFGAADSPAVAVWLRAPARPGATGCGVGAVRIGDRSVPLRLEDPAVPGSLVRAVPCGRVRVAAGTTVLAISGAGGFVPDYAVLGPAPAATTGGSLVTTTHAANPGWSAGPSAPAEVVDGWRQAYASAGPVRERFTPQSAHLLGLLTGAALVLLLLAAAIVGGFGRAPRAPGLPVQPAALTAAGARSGRPASRRRMAGGLLAVLVGGLAAGPIGLLIGVLVALIPRRWRVPAGAAALVLAGVALATLGVVDARSAGAALGQVLGTLTLCALASELLDRTDAPGAAPAAPATAPTPGR